MTRVNTSLAFLLSILCPLFHSVAQINNVNALIDQDDVVSFRKLKLNSAELDELLFLSTRRKANKIAEFLISKRVPVNVHDSTGTTPLIIAVSNQDIELIKFLLAKGADPNLKEKLGLQGTPLMYACSFQDVTVPQLLINAGAKVNVLDKNMDPAINWATYYGNVKVMELLIAKGADLSIKSKHGTSVDVGLRLWHADSVMEVFRKTKFSATLTEKQSALLHAVKMNNLAQALALLIEGVTPNTTDGLGTPTLQIAASLGHHEMLKLLLENGANPDQLNRVGQSPLAFAARFNDSEAVNLLLKSGADPNKAGEHYRLTPLMGAAVGGDLSIGMALIRADAAINTTDSVNHCSALHWAMFYNNIDFAEMLLVKGADFNKKVLDNNYTGVTLAKAYGYQPLVKLMHQLVGQPNSLIGSWTINEIQYIYKDTTVTVERVHQGRLTVTPNRYHIIYNPWINARIPFEKLSRPTDEEIKKAFQSIVFNTGTYVISDSLLTTTSDIAKVPGFEGGKQFYRINLKGDQLELIMADETYPSGEKPEWYQKLQILFKLTRE